MKKSEIKFTKQIYMALVNAYAACGEFEEAKKVWVQVARHVILALNNYLIEFTY